MDNTVASNIGKALTQLLSLPLDFDENAKGPCP